MKASFNFIFFAFLLFMISCDDQTTEPDKLPPHELEAVEKRITEFAHKKSQDCIEKALGLATARVDSTLLQMDVLIPIDVQGNIPRPQRPLPPIKREKTDTTEIKPFIPSARDSQ